MRLEAAASMAVHLYLPREHEKYWMQCSGVKVSTRIREPSHASVSVSTAMNLPACSYGIRVQPALHMERGGERLLNTGRDMSTSVRSVVRIVEKGPEDMRTIQLCLAMAVLTWCGMISASLAAPQVEPDDISICGVRLSMEREEVRRMFLEIAKMELPEGRGPHLGYFPDGPLFVRFGQDDTVSAVMGPVLEIHKSPRFRQGRLSQSSSAEEVEAVLGAPTRRSEDSGGGYDHLWYEQRFPGDIRLTASISWCFEQVPNTYTLERYSQKP